MEGETLGSWLDRCTVQNEAEEAREEKERAAKTEKEGREKEGGGCGRRPVPWR